MSALVVVIVGSHSRAGLLEPETKRARGACKRPIIRWPATRRHFHISTSGIQVSAGAANLKETVLRKNRRRREKIESNSIGRRFAADLLGWLATTTTATAHLFRGICERQFAYAIPPSMRSQGRIALRRTDCRPFAARIIIQTLLLASLRAERHPFCFRRSLLAAFSARSPPKLAAD